MALVKELNMKDNKEIYRDLGMMKDLPL